MKIKKSESQKNKELKLRLIKTKTYSPLIKIEDILIRLKKAVHIIFKYHLSNKRILFLSSCLELIPKINNLLENTKHIIIPESSWANGMLTNRTRSNKKITDKPKSFKPVRLKKKSDLLVILNRIENRNILDESHSARIPTIYFNSDLEVLDRKPSFKIPGSFKFTKKKIDDSFFCLILGATIKRAKLAKLIQKKTDELLLKMRSNTKKKDFYQNSKSHRSKNGYRQNKK